MQRSLSRNRRNRCAVRFKQKFAPPLFDALAGDLDAFLLAVAPIASGKAFAARFCGDCFDGTGFGFTADGHPVSRRKDETRDALRARDKYPCDQITPTD